jgi:hypothetical protein
MYTKANANAQAENEKAELLILSEYLPAEVTSEETSRLIDESISQLKATTIQDMGKVIADVKAKNSGVDGSVVAQLVRQKLS